MDLSAYREHAEAAFRSYWDALESVVDCDTPEEVEQRITALTDRSSDEQLDRIVDGSGVPEHALGEAVDLIDCARAALRYGVESCTWILDLD